MSAPFRDLPSLPPGPPIEAAPAPPEAWAAAAVAASPAPPPAGPRVWATVGFGAASVLAAVVGSFAPWARYADGASRSGVEHGDGYLVLLVSFVAAGLCGAVAVGLRHLAARAALGACGLVLFALYLANRWNLSRAHDLVTGRSLEVGGGLYAVAFCALGLVVASLAMPSTPWWEPRQAAKATIT